MTRIIQFVRKFEGVKQRSRARALRRLVSVTKLWRSLNVAQRCYALATLLCIIFHYFNMLNALTKAGIGALIITAVLYEFWPRFMVAWDSLPGKAGILFVYAVIGNFALASASGLLNSVTGVSASSLPYSHNFAIILMLPSWFFVTTLLALVLVQLLMPLYLIILLVLKPFGIHGLWHAPEYRFVFTTALVRYIWMLVVLLKVAELSTESGVVNFFSGAQDEEIAEALATKLKSVELKPAEDVAKEHVPEDEAQEVIFDLSAQGEQFRLFQREWLATFVFEYEADEFSRCAHPEGSRVVELNDYEILAITPSKDHELGYSYEVLACQSAAIGVSITP